MATRMAKGEEATSARAIVENGWLNTRTLKDSIVVEKMTGTVEIDETYVWGRRRGTKRGRPGPDSHKAPAVSLVQRGGKVRSMHMERVTVQNPRMAMREHIDPSATLLTDELHTYRRPARDFAGHESVNHGAGDYLRSDVHVNTAEGFFFLLKRGINGTYHHVGKQHLYQYLGEFDFRYNTRSIKDGQRTIQAIGQGKGKRMMLRRVRRQTKLDTSAPLRRDTSERMAA